MALGTYTLKELRSDIQIRLNDLPPSNNYAPPVINHWLNLAQNKLAKILYQIDSRLYRQDYQTSISSAEIDLSNQSCAHIEEVLWSAGGNTGQIRILPLRKFTDMVNMSLYDNRIFAYRESKDKLVLSVNFSGDIEAIYLREPTKMTADAVKLDIPDGYAELVILIAMGMSPKYENDPIFQQKIMAEGQKVFGDEFQELSLSSAKFASNKEE